LPLGSLGQGHESDLSPEELFNADPPELWVPKDLAAGVPPEEIVAKLMQHEYSQDEAVRFLVKMSDDLVELATPEGRKRHRKEAAGYTVVGVFLVVAGLLLAGVCFVGQINVGFLYALFGSFVLTGSFLVMQGDSKKIFIQSAKDSEAP
jgi:hypothetical protein